MQIKSAIEYSDNADGVFDGMLAPQYFAAPGLSNSMAKNLDRTPAHYRHYLTTKDDDMPSEALILGTLIHQTLLEPATDWPQVAVKPKDLTYRTGEGKLWKQQQESAGKIILGVDAFDTLRRAIDGACTDPFVASILKDSVHEAALFTGSYGLRRKGKLDIIPRDGSDFLCDFKSVDDAGKGAFEKKLVDFCWHSQSAWYLDLWNELNPGDKRNCFVVVCLEKTTGFVAPYIIHPDAVELGRRVNADRIRRLLEWQADGTWPAYPQCPIPIATAPRWAFKSQGLD